MKSSSKNKTQVSTAYSPWRAVRIEVANAAASICVQRMGAGTSMPSATEVAEVNRLALAWEVEAASGG